MTTPPPLVLFLKLELIVDPFLICPLTVARTAFSLQASPWVPSLVETVVQCPGLSLLKPAFPGWMSPGEASAALPLEAFQPFP